jgi:DNA-cytosine methyltransferase
MFDVDSTPNINHVSLCTGYGGIDLGLKRALRTVCTIAASEIEAFACANLVKKMEQGLLDSCPIWTDLRTFPFRDFYQKIDILSSGFPCQPFSAAGKRAADSDPRHLWPHIIRGIRQAAPAICFFENVEGIYSAKLKGSQWADIEGTPVLLHILRELERAGYKATSGTYSAAEVGAPHQRKRVFIMGIRADLSDSFREHISAELAYTYNTRPYHSSSCKVDQIRQETGEGWSELTLPQSSRYSYTRWPASRGREQHPWEPPRVVEHSMRKRLGRLSQCRKNGREESKGQGHKPTKSSPSGHVQRPTESSVGGDFDGPASGLGVNLLHYSTDSRIDEIRLLGNGVVPQTAERAFRLLWDKLN